MGVEGLIEQLKTIPDWRRGRTVQYPLWLMLLMSLLGVMSGYSSLRGLEEFRQRHAQEAAELFGLAKAKLPRYSTLRDMADHVDGVAVAQVFLEWAQGNVGVSGGEAISMDGKALGSTVSDPHGQQQNFVTVVSACVQASGCVIGQISFQNGKSSEIPSVRQLLEQLDLSGVWVTLDALHCQKNSL